MWLLLALMIAGLDRRRVRPADDRPAGGDRAGRSVAAAAMDRRSVRALDPDQALAGRCRAVPRGDGAALGAARVARFASRPAGGELSRLAPAARRGDAGRRPGGPRPAGSARPGCSRCCSTTFPGRCCAWPICSTSRSRRSSLSVQVGACRAAVARAGAVRDPRARAGADPAARIDPAPGPQRRSADARRRRQHGVGNSPPFGAQVRAGPGQRRPNSSANIARASTGLPANMAGSRATLRCRASFRPSRPASPRCSCWSPGRASWSCPFRCLPPAWCCSRGWPRPRSACCSRRSRPLRPRRPSPRSSAGLGRCRTCRAQTGPTRLRSTGRALDLEDAAFRHESGRGLSPITLSLERGRWLGLARALGGGQDHARRSHRLPSPAATGVAAGRRPARWRASGWSNGAPASPISARMGWCLPTASPPTLPPARRDRRRGDVGGAGGGRAGRPRARPSPTGFTSRLGEGGSTLSGGERQRLLIARAMLRRPTLIILDEATAALDPEAEAAVLAALRRLDSRPAAILVAHRNSTLGHCEIGDRHPTFALGRHAVSR